MGPRVELWWRIGLLAAVAGVCVGSRRAGAQGPCGLAPVVARDAQPNIFSDQQEEWLGDAMADMIEQYYAPVRDPTENAYLQRVADRLEAILPPHGFKYRAMLIDSADINGFSIAGGRIYLTRRLVATAQNEDEVAAVLGHEMGHIASHQFAFRATRNLKRLLGVTQVGDRVDVYAKFQALMNAEIRDKHPGDPSAEDKQDEADRIGIYVAAAAGYKPLAEADFWDRSFFVGGKTGGRLTDILGITQPHELRLRGMRRMATSLPAGCGGTRPNMGPEFIAWRDTVRANQAGLNRSPEGGREIALSPPLRPPLDQLQFDREGKRVLAQDASSVFVLSLKPLAVEFRMDAGGASAAQFSPDSTKIVFSTPGPRVETWDVAEKRLVDTKEMLAKQRCMQAVLSPDGRTLVCLTLTFLPTTVEIDLHLLDVATGAVVWEKNKFFDPYFLQASAGRMMLEPFSRDVLPWTFSADGNFLLIGPGGSKLAVDLRTRTPVTIGKDLRKSVTGDYAFVGNDRVAGVNGGNPKASGIFSFPDGRQIEKTPGVPAWIEAVANPGRDPVVIERGGRRVGAALMNLWTGKMVERATRAMDEWDGLVVTENDAGDVELSRLDGDAIKGVESVALPLSLLSRPSSAVVSGDGKFLALSIQSRGGVWDLSTGKRLFATGGFTDAMWTAGDVLYVDVAKEGKSARHLTEISTATDVVRDLPYVEDEKNHLHELGLMDWKAGAKDAVTLVMRRPADGTVAWSKGFVDGQPQYTESLGDRDLIFSYPLDRGAARARLKAEGGLAAEEGAVAHKDLARLIEVVDAGSGKTVKESVVEMPENSAGTNGLNRAGDLLYVTTRDHRTLVCSLESGKEVRQMFGEVGAVDVRSGRIAMVNRRGEALVFGADGAELAHFLLGRTLRFEFFADGGKSLMVLTDDQKISTMEIAAGK